ncbi:MAG: hypothetical protein QGI68_20070 [Pseudomonadales bacterium]|nr:hypothetical protein [Pseudomonadales bacterium]MDP7357238.1 hypothetical protein [Pseudomonadales bacterium]MDP7597841.1 hypothetical protein [Pseudomonadales bacterium]HJN50764.1 hypothetical protein [Pseudomonadales bacterium]
MTKEKSIAVLPFANMSNDPDQEYFSDGMAEEIINGRVKFPAVKVIARTSSFQFKGENRDIREIGKRLNVSHVLEGSIRTAGKRIRVTAQLILVSDGMHLWSNRYDRELADVFVVQDEITAEILKALHGHLATTEEQPARATNMGSYNAYLLGRHHLFREQFDEAAKSFEESISLDSEYADAYVGLVQVNTFFFNMGVKSKEETQPLIDEYTARALTLNPNHPMLLTLKAQQLFFGHRDYQRAINDLSDLVTQRPNDPQLLQFYAKVFAPIGRLDVSIEILKHGVELDPLSPAAHLQLGRFCIFADKFDAAHRSIEHGKSLGGNGCLYLAMIATNTGDSQTLQNQLDQGKEAWGETSHFYPIYEAVIPSLASDIDRAKKILAPLKHSSDYQSFVMKQLIASLEGEIELALEYCTRALESSEIPAFLEIHGTLADRKRAPDYYAHPRYSQMLRDFGFDRESVSKLEIPSLPF